MTPEQQAAFLSSQVACASFECSAMQIENLMAMSEGKKPPHGPEEFRALADKFGIHHNAALGTLGR